MASISKASTPLVKICLFLITAINVAAASRRSVLADLYKQAAEQNRPLILVVDNHSKNEAQSYQSHSNKHESDEIPFHYMYPRVTSPPPKSVNVQEKKPNKNVKQDLLKFYLSRLLLQNKDKGVGLKKKISRSDDRDDYRNLDNRNYYRDDRDQRDRRDRYRERGRNVDVTPHRYDKDRDTRYNKKPVDRYYYRPKESREYKVREKHYYAPEDRDRHDRERYDRDRRDRYRSEKTRDERDRVDRYRSEKDRVDRDRYDRYRSEKVRDDRGDIIYGQSRNKERDYDKVKDWYRDERDRYQPQSKYQPPRSKDRHLDDYGANVLKNLLRISNDLNCDAKYECKGSCQRVARMLRQNGNDNCEDLCDEEYDCEESKEKTEKVEKKEDRQDDGCDARGSDESCGDEKGTNLNISTRGPPQEDEKGGDDDCLDNGNDNRC